MKFKDNNDDRRDDLTRAVADIEHWDAGYEDTGSGPQSKRDRDKVRQERPRARTKITSSSLNPW